MVILSRVLVISSTLELLTRGRFYSQGVAAHAVIAKDKQMTRSTTEV